MSRNYDNWGKLVSAVARKIQLRELASCHSRNHSSSSSDSDNSYGMVASDLEEPFDFYEDVLDASIPEFNCKKLRPKRYIREERNGKICYMSGARQLLILKRRPSQYWDRAKRDDSRFSEVAVLHYGHCLDIRGRIKTRLLSPNTLYVAYLVFKLSTWSKGLQSVEAVVNFFDKEADIDAQERACSVFLQHQRRRGPCGPYATRRVDGWMEVEIGHFRTDEEDKGVEARVFEFYRWKTGLTIEGIEFRPYSTESTQFSCQLGYQLVPVDETTGTPIFPPIRGEGSEIDETMDIAENEETEDSEFDMSLLQEFVPELNSKTQSSSPLSSTSATLESDYPLKQNTLRRIKASNESEAESRNGQEHSLVPEKSIHNPALDQTLRLYLEKSSPQNQPSGAPFSRDELFSGSYDSLSELANFINGMKTMLERKDMETEDMKQKLLKTEVDAQLALAAKDSEIEELWPKVEILQVEAHKAQQEVNKANEKIKELEQKLKDYDVRAASAVEMYKNSDELKIVKHKFASKAFSIGFQFCVKQVLEVDPSFNTSRIDVKRLESSSFIVMS